MTQTKIRCWVYHIFPAYYNVETGEVEMNGGGIVVDILFSLMNSLATFFFSILGGEPTFPVWFSEKNKALLPKDVKDEVEAI